MDLTSYRTLGRSGLVVSPLALGTMTFGAGRYGTSEEASRRVFDAYTEAGGNFFDTADVYAAGAAESMLGEFIGSRGDRDRSVIATKFGYPQGDVPLNGGNGAKNIRVALDASLRRLGTDYVDLYYLHAWDRITPAEEVLRALTDAIAAGKVLHYGFSNAPSWYVAKIATLAQAHGLPTPIAVQYNYSLTDRGVELDVLPMTENLGLGTVAWGPLQAGLLTGKYDRSVLDRAAPDYSLPQQSEGNPSDGASPRLMGSNPTGGLPFTAQNFDVVDVLREVAAELDRPMAQVALAWLTQRSGLTSAIIGASRAEQVIDNVSGLDITLSETQQARLDDAGAPVPVNPFALFSLPTAALYATDVQGFEATTRGHR